MSKTIQDTRTAKKRALLVGIQLPKVPEAELQSSLEELRRLVDTLGYDVVGQTHQRRSSTEGSIVVGEGKLVELAAWCGGPGIVQPKVKVKKTRAAEKFKKKDKDGNYIEDEPEDDEEDSGEDSGDDSFKAEYLAGTGDGSTSGVGGTNSGDPELEALANEAEEKAGPQGTADVIVFDCELSPSQLRNLESAAPCSTERA
jgi:GTP-binding protein HflX